MVGRRNMGGQSFSLMSGPAPPPWLSPAFMVWARTVAPWLTAWRRFIAAAHSGWADAPADAEPPAVAAAGAADAGPPGRAPARGCGGAPPDRRAAGRQRGPGRRTRAELRAARDDAVRNAGAEDRQAQRDSAASAMAMT